MFRCYCYLLFCLYHRYMYCSEAITTLVRRSSPFLPSTRISLLKALNTTCTAIFANRVLMAMTICAPLFSCRFLYRVRRCREYKRRLRYVMSARPELICWHWMKRRRGCQFPVMLVFCSCIIILIFQNSVEISVVSLSAVCPISVR